MTGAGSTATLALTATTAQITRATGTVVGVDDVWQLASSEVDHPFVTVLIDCAYGDPNPLKLQVAVQSQSSNALLIDPIPPISVPQPLEKVINPRMPGWDFWWPSPDRVGKVTVSASLIEPAISRGPRTVYFHVTTPDFPWLTNPPLVVKIPYKIPEETL